MGKEFENSGNKIKQSPEQDRLERVQRFLREECPDVKPKQNLKKESGASLDVFSPTPIGKMRTNVFYIDSKK